MWELLLWFGFSLQTMTGIIISLFTYGVNEEKDMWDNVNLISQCYRYLIWTEMTVSLGEKIQCSAWKGLHERLFISGPAWLAWPSVPTSHLGCLLNGYTCVQLKVGKYDCCMCDLSIFCCHMLKMWSGVSVILYCEWKCWMGTCVRLARNSVKVDL